MMTTKKCQLIKTKNFVMPRSRWGGVGRERGLLKWTQHNTKTHTVKITQWYAHKTSKQLNE